MHIAYFIFQLQFLATNSYKLIIVIYCDISIKNFIYVCVYTHAYIEVNSNIQDIFSFRQNILMSKLWKVTVIQRLLILK